MVPRQQIQQQAETQRRLTSMEHNIELLLNRFVPDNANNATGNENISDEEYILTGRLAV